MSPQALQVIMVIGPILITAVLGPILVTLVNKVKARAEIENEEVQADKARFEAVDMVIRHLRDDANNLRNEVLAEREANRELRITVDRHERERSADERAWADMLRWAQRMYRQLVALGQKPPPAPIRRSYKAVFEDDDDDGNEVCDNAG